jgi:TonB family protein
MPPRVVRAGLPDIVSPHCGTVTLSAVVDAKGKAGEIAVLHADNPDLGSLVTKLLAKTKFEPGTYNGVPAAVAITATVAMQYCVRHLLSENMSISVSVREQPQDDTRAPPGSSSVRAAAPSDTVYRIGGPVSPPVVLHSVPAKFSSYARKKKISGFCLIGLIVDAEGLPQNVHVIQSLEPSLDENAMEAIKQYRFKPALKDGTVAVPVEVTVKVDFRLY